MCRYPTERYFANALFQCVCVCVSDFLEFAWHGLYCLIIYRISMKRIITSKKLTNHHINRICTIFRLYLGVCVCVFFSLLQALLYTQHKFHLILVSASLGSSICVWYRLGMGWEKKTAIYTSSNCTCLCLMPIDNLRWTCAIAEDRLGGGLCRVTSHTLATIAPSLSGCIPNMTGIVSKSVRNHRESVCKSWYTNNWNPFKCNFLSLNGITCLMFNGENGKFIER